LSTETSADVAPPKQTLDPEKLQKLVAALKNQIAKKVVKVNNTE
jgi:5,10-methylenetetrahydrofolate reductase